MNTSNFTVEANACLKESIALNNQQTIYLVFEREHNSQLKSMGYVIIAL